MDKELKRLLEKEYQKGVLAGIRLMEERLMLAHANGTGVEIKGRMWYLKSDLENLRDVMDKFGSEE